MTAARLNALTEARVASARIEERSELLNVLQKAANSNNVVISALRQTAEALGGAVTSVTQGIDAGKHWVRITIGY